MGIRNRIYGLDYNVECKTIHLIILNIEHILNGTVFPKNLELFTT